MTSSPKRSKKRLAPKLQAYKEELETIEVLHAGRTDVPFLTLMDLAERLMAELVKVDRTTWPLARRRPAR
jgi:hypothetical protein